MLIETIPDNPTNWGQDSKIETNCIFSNQQTNQQKSAKTTPKKDNFYLTHPTDD